VVKCLMPLVLRHFNRTDLETWEFRDDSPLRRPTRSMNREVEKLLRNLIDFLPPEPSWDRTRNRLRTDHGRAQIRRQLGRVIEDGDPCLCGSICRYPVAP